MITVFVRTLVIYVILILSMRLMGKRQIGELQISELVITFMLSELAVIPITDKHIPISYAVLPILLLLSLEVIISFLMMKSKVLKKFFFGRPSIIINKGKLYQKELSDLRIDINELLCELRLKNIASISDVEYAILEENGKLSVFPKSEKAPLTADTMSLKPTEHGIAHAVILDGAVSEVNLKCAKKDRGWLDNELSARGLESENIFLMSVDDAGEITVIANNKESK